MKLLLNEAKSIKKYKNDVVAFVYSNILSVKFVD